MPIPRVLRGQALAAELLAAGCRATTDVNAVTALAPCVLVSPPRLNFAEGGYAGPLATWRLLVVAGTADETRAWSQLDDLLEQLADLLPLDTADPASFVLPGASDTRPAYAATYTETVES